MEIGIVGGGAIGLLLATKLANQHDVTIYVKSNEQKQAINNDGVCCLPKQDTYSIHAELLEACQLDEIIFICVKQYDLVTVMDHLKQRSSILVFLQNGMAHVNMLEEMNVTNPIFIGTCEHAARREDHRTVTNTGEGKINLAIYQGDESLLKKYGQLLSNQYFPIECKNDWKNLLLEKLIINSVINPITAVHHVRNGALLFNSDLATIALALTNEVASALGMDPDQQWERVQTIVALTEGNDSSMKADLDHGRKTEIDGILGYVKAHATRPTPLIDLYASAIKEQEGGV